jgi:predicted DCC family thiol-disulfide oxidoreductase YuxK
MKVPEDKSIVLFDGVCNLCNSAVQTIIKYDKKNKFVFASLQSEIGRHLLSERDINTKTTDSIVLIIPNEAYFIKSDAALEIAKKLSGIFQFFGVFKLLPKVLRDLLYDFIAKNRYKFFGQKAQCMIPEKPVRHKFL